MCTGAFEDKDIQYAYTSIHDFFDFFGLSNALLNTEHLLKAAISDKAWKKICPGTDADT